MFVYFVLAAVAVLVAANPNPIINGDSLMQLVNTTANGKLFKINHPLYANTLPVVHLYGSPAEMGRAYGQLMGATIYEFMTVGIDQYLNESIDGLDLSSLPVWLQNEIKTIAKTDAPGALHAALNWVYTQEKSHMEQSRSQPIAEANAMAQGICESGTVPNCDPTALSLLVITNNLLPELIKMSCSMFGAWGGATASGGLVQLRSLDFGGGPFAQYATLVVYHPSSGNNFANLGFAGFTGAVTGFSTQVALSEKVWETYTGTGMQPGHYDGLPVITVIRDMLQFANTKEDALAFAQSITRTWAVFLGVGDNSSQEFRALAFRESDVNAYAPNNITNITGFPMLADVVMIDKHPQPTHDPTTMPQLLLKFYGQITGENTAANMPNAMQTGDVHIMVYDFHERRVYLSLGVVDSNGNYGPTGMACDQPFLSLNMDAILAVSLA